MFLTHAEISPSLIWCQQMSPKSVEIQIFRMI